MIGILRNRKEAGQSLARELAGYAGRPDVIVLALPRGGVPVAYEIARQLRLPLDICLVRKLGVPGHQELAMGAIASGGVRFINQGVVNSLHITPSILDKVAREEQKVLEHRERTYRGNRPLPDLRDRTIILVDDGIATGSTLRAAITALRYLHPKAIVVAIPVAPPSVCRELASEVERVVCLQMPESMHSISLWYEDFSQTTDEEVCDLLDRAREGIATVG